VPTSEPACITKCLGYDCFECDSPLAAAGCPDYNCMCRSDIVSTTAASFLTSCITASCSQGTLGPDISIASSILFGFCSQWTDPAFVVQGTAPTTTTATSTAVVTGGPITTPPPTTAPGSAATTIVVVTTVLSTSTGHTTSESIPLLWAGLGVLLSAAMW
jgi:hypothetical protein